MKDLKETIELLNHIQEKPKSTQRELVEKLDVSLGKVNFLVSALTEKGLIKLERFKNSRNKLGYLYMITPKGIKEKAEITKDFLDIKTREYDMLKAQIERLKTQIGNNVRDDQGMGIS